MKSNEFLELKLKSSEKMIDILESKISSLKEENKILKRKLDNATETINHLNKKEMFEFTYSTKHKNDLMINYFKFKENQINKYIKTSKMAIVVDYYVGEVIYIFERLKDAIGMIKYIEEHDNNFPNVCVHYNQKVYDSSGNIIPKSIYKEMCL